MHKKEQAMAALNELVTDDETLRGYEGLLERDLMGWKFGRMHQSFREYATVQWGGWGWVDLHQRLEGPGAIRIISKKSREMQAEAKAERKADELAKRRARYRRMVERKKAGDQ